MMRIMSYADYKMTRHSPILECMLTPVLEVLCASSAVQSDTL